MHRLIIVGAATIVSLVALTVPQEAQPAPNLMTAYQRGFVNKDVDGLAALYGEDAVLLPPNEPAVKGRGAIRDWYRKSFASGISGFRLRSTSTVSEGSAEFEWGTYSVVLPSDADGAAQRFDMKYVWSLRKSPTGWYIASHMFNSDR